MLNAVSFPAAKAAARLRGIARQIRGKPLRFGVFLRLRLSARRGPRPRLGPSASQSSQKAKGRSGEEKYGAAKKEFAKAAKHPAKESAKLREPVKPRVKAARPLPHPHATADPEHGPPAFPFAPTVPPAAAPPKWPPQVQVRRQPIRWTRTFATCLACHGSGGLSETAELPSISAQPGPFVIKQLTLFRDGKRKSPLAH